MYDDQYLFYKELKSKRLLIAFVEFMFEDIEPTWLNKMEKVIRNSLKIRMENQKKKSLAWSLSHWWWRKKIESNPNSELDSKNNTMNNRKTTEWTTKKQEDKDISISNNILISKDIKSVNTDKRNPEIDECLEIIKSFNWWMIDWTQKWNRIYWKNLIWKLKQSPPVLNWDYTWQDTLKAILQVISQNKYHRSKITNPKTIYDNLTLLFQVCNEEWTTQKIDVI